MPRDAMQALPMPSWGVCLSVCLSVSPAVCQCHVCSKLVNTSSNLFFYI